MLERSHHVEHAIGQARAQIDNEARIAIDERVERGEVPAREVDRVHTKQVNRLAHGALDTVITRSGTVV